MGQVRLAAAMLALLTVLITILFWFIPGIEINATASTTLAAACLIIVAPFEALDRAARERVLAACITYVAAIGVALWFALQTPVEQATIVTLAMLATAGLVLVAWSFKIRKHRRRPRWSNYYDR